MKLQMYKVLSFAPVLILLAATTAFADGVVTLSPGPVGAGQHFTVAVNITGPTVKDVPSGVSDVYAFELDVSFPSSVVQARQVADGAFLSGGGTTYFSKGAIDNGGGTISHIFGTLVSAPSGASGSGTLVNITFQAVTAGTPEITLTKITLLDSNLNPIVVDNTPAQMTTTVALTTAEMRNPYFTPIGPTPIHGIPYWPVGAWELTAPRAHIAKAAALERTAASPDEPFRSNASAIGTGPLDRFAGSVTGLHPQDRLPDGVVANDLRNRGVRVKALPKRKIAGFSVGESGEKKTGLAHRQIVEVFHVLPIGPAFLVPDIRNHETEARFESAPVGQLIRPKIIARRRENARAHAQNIQIEERIAVGLGAGKLKRKASIERDLPRKNHGLEPVPTIPPDRVVSRVSRETSGLQQPAGAVIIFCVPLLPAMRGGGEPMKIVGEPGMGSLLVASGEHACAFKDESGLGDLNQMYGIDDADAASGADAVDGLRVFEIGVHAGVGSDEPRAQMRDSVVGVLAFPGEQPGGGERGHLDAESNKQVAMRGKVGGV